MKPMDEPLEPSEADHGPMAQWPIGRLLSVAARLVEHSWTDALDHAGLTHAGFIALHIIGEEPISQTEVASRAKVENQTMSRTLDRLERDGFVSRERDPRDRRKHILTRTAQGAAAWESARHLEADVFPEVTDPEALRSALLELIHAGSAQRWRP